MASGRLGQSSTKHSVHVRFDTARLIHLIDRNTSNFRSGNFYLTLTRANEKLASVVQQGMADELDRNMNHARPQRAGKRLEKSILSPKNVEIFANTFSVGLENWLNRSPAALYWRQIDEGMGGYSTRALFSDTGGPPWVRPGVRGSNMRMPQFARGARIDVDPIVALDYSAGGRQAFDRVDAADVYERYLRAAGFPITKETRAGIFK